jgi:hypothetical protein
MKKNKLLILLLILLAGANLTYSQMVSKAEAEQIASNWIQMVIDKYGHWGNGESAVLQPVQEFRNNNRMLGYYFQVLPSGYIVVSIRKELAPVKVYDDYFTLDPAEDKGMTELVKSSLLRIIDTIESRLGAIDAIDPSDLAAILEIDYRPNWDYVYGYIPGTIQKSISGTDNYEEGEVLLSSIWHQYPPYNNDCPDYDCTTTSNGRALVGCVATAGSQIMKYWSWPPEGLGTGWNDAYDWPNMPDNATTSSPAAVQAAVSELNNEVGIAVAMDYGCDASGAYTYDMINVYEQFYAYHTSCAYTQRPYYTATDWFEQIKAQINANRPIQYRIPGHSIVCDGWQYFGFVMLYHMNYGWADGATTWYVVDDLQGGDPNEEYMIVNIVPLAAMGPSLSGTYVAQSYPYRYFDLDASGSSATFNSAQLLQILPELTITGTGTSTYVKFYGSTGLHTRIFTDGNLTEGILIQNGGIRLKNNGSIKLQ